MVRRNKRKFKAPNQQGEHIAEQDSEDTTITLVERNAEYSPVMLTRLENTLNAAKNSLDRYESVLIGGPVGCGKSTFVNNLAKEFCCKVHSIQISEQTDAKTLLGAYCCTEVPGQFIWRPGPLISAMKQGYALILEDIDRGSAELQLLITSVLRKLKDCSSSLNNGVLVDPVNGNPIHQHKNFRLLMTRRFVTCQGGDFRQEYVNPLIDLLDRYCFVITLPNFSKDEIYLLINQQYPTLTPFIDRIMKIYLFIVDAFQNANINVNNSHNNASRIRGISVRDLLKFCSRISMLTEKENFGELLLLNAVDCFLCSMCNSLKQLELACRLAGELNFTVENARNILCCRSIGINLHTQKSILQIGRIILQCRRSPEWEIQIAGGNSMLQSSNELIWPFASTRLSCSLLERIAVAVKHKEPVLLVGETGTGKTSTVQRLAYLTGHRLKVINLNQQSDSVDLMGGFKPVDFQVFVRPIREKFESLFSCTFKLDSNATFLNHINTCFTSERWLDLITLMRHPARVAVQRDSADSSAWIKLLNELNMLEKRFENITKSNKPGLGFAFIEGALVRAVQDGDWILLDEINLAPAEMLDSLSGLLDSERGSLVLTERGDSEPVQRHKDFHLFAAMNPATDVGKRELPVGLRNRFTEFYVPELDPGVEANPNTSTSTTTSNINSGISDNFVNTITDSNVKRDLEILRSNNREDLATLARSYLLALNPTPSQLATIVRLYSALRQAALEGLVDGVGQRPHFSLRTLCRALIEAGRGYHGSVLRSLYEGLIFSFGSQICRTSRPILDTLIQRYLSSGWNTDSVSLLRQLNTPLPIPPLNSLPAANIDNSTTTNTNTTRSQCPEDYFINVEGYWLPKGSQQPVAYCDKANNNTTAGNYILTPSVQANLKDLARVVSAGGGLPVLLQGETSVGKTSLITYLAKRVGQVCYRINNHEHTDQQTYLGTYTVSSTAQATSKTLSTTGEEGNLNGQIKSASPLVFKDGLLVKAMRYGYWIILDELNLAPTEILEALNRVLDDNRSVFITETQETVKAHPHFRLFATQNPPGLYAGRKMLSRALRNRFIELHFDTIPRNELEIILEKKCLLPPSRAHRLVEVMHRLQLARCSSNLFQGKDSFITLRDLFRWAERYRLATCDKVSGCHSGDGGQVQLFDWDAYLADQGYLLLAGRVRNPNEVQVVAEVIETVFKRKVTESRLFDLNEESSPAVYEFLQPILSVDNTICQPAFQHIVWTRDMRRLLVLIGNALKYEEPVLLVGETGCGKTTICQVIAALHNQRLHCVNCHQCTEASDFLGGLRPVRHSSTNNEATNSTDDSRLFEWVNGPLVVAMLNGDLFLLDEISLADDAVLERLNSLLEPERQLHLAECTEDLLDGTSLDTTQLTADPKFRFIATMNPGGDYGKKELSPALRNRFTEIWCPSPTFTAVHPSSLSSSVRPDESLLKELSNPLTDWIDIVQHNLKLKLPNIFSGENNRLARQFSEKMVNFIQWLAVTQEECKSNGITSLHHRSPPTIRDLIAWIEFIRTVVRTNDDSQADSYCQITGTTTTTTATIDLFSACIHGACLIFLDALDETANTKTDDQGNCNNVNNNPTGFFCTTIRYLIDQMSSIDKNLIDTIQQPFPDFETIYANFCTPMNEEFVLKKSTECFGCDPFFIPTGPYLPYGDDVTTPTSFIFDAPTPASNLKRLLRAMQLPGRALLLEGSPGVGKTTLVMALAKASGHKVIRINLSEATEASDLFGCDLPVEGAEAGVFAWKSGPFLQGLCDGHWIVLDEMNLASQSVLECLNACLDHRGEVFIPELNTTFKINSKTTRLFACQNPLREGGGRKGLPRSFLNRFTQVYMRSLTISDQEFILSQLYPDISTECIHIMVAFNDEVNKRINVEHEFGSQGGPWEFNLRDLTRWCDLLVKGKEFEGINPGLYVHLLYTDRMRTLQDKQKIVTLWIDVCKTLGMQTGAYYYYEPRGNIFLLNESIHCGLAHFLRSSPEEYSSSRVDNESCDHLLLLDRQRSVLESFLKVIEMGWMVMLIGPPGCGKRTLAHIASILLGQKMLTMCLSPTSDTIELLGSLEQREAGGLFEWVDSPLVKGIIDGSWVLIENAQLCSPSTLDRLNSLLEPNGELLLSERGLDANGKLITLKAHPDFRLILAVDEICGPTGGGGCSVGGSTGISRAMRNRGLEITFIEPISLPHLDLLRLFTSINVPKSIAIGLLEFHSLFLEACENPSCIEQHLQRFNERRQSSSPVANIFQLVTCHSFKKPPIGALISAGQYAKQLLANPSQLGDGSPLGEKSSNKMLKKKKKIKRIKRLKKSKREEIPVDLDEDDGDDVDDKCSSEVDINRILNHVLQFVYCQRQMHVKAIEFVKWLITYYVDNAFIDKASSTDTGSDQRLLHLPERYLHHSVNELVSRRSSPNGYRQFHVSLIDLTLSDYSTSSIITSELLLLAKRILLEQANPSETHLENDQFMKMLTSSSSSVSVRQLKLYYDLTTWPDLRWIPGWKHFIGLLGCPPPDVLLYEWNKRLYSLLLAELYESTMNVSDVDSQAFTCTKPADLCHLPLLQVIKSASENHLPAMWLDAYPGLTELHDKWLDYLHNLWNQFPATSTSEQCDLSFFYTAICKAWSWIHLFACRPLGDSFDWPERCSFHNQRAVLTSDDRFNLDLPKLSTITQCFLSKSTPPSMITGKEYEMYSSPMYNAAFCVDWLQFGQILNEFLLRLTSSSNGTSELNLDRDYSDNDDDSDSGGDSDLGEDSNAINDEDMMNAKQAIIPLSGTTDDHLGGDIYRDILKFYCLWPWTMILMSKYIETELLNTTHNSNNSSGNHQYYIQLKTSLRIYIRCVLMSLNRPGLLASLVMTQSVLKNSNTEQSRIAKQLLMEEFSMMPSSSTSSSTKMSASSSTSTTSSFSSMLSFLFQRLDWSLPSELTSLQTVNQPDILGEWRSVSQALINITWPMLYDYGAYAYRGKLTVYGWRYRQHIIQDANYLLFLSPPSSNELSNSPENDNLQSSDIKTVVQLAFTLLQGIYRSLKSIGKSHPTGENNLPVYSNGVCLSLIDLLNWINITLKPSIDLIKTSCLTNRQSSSDWYHIARLTELLIEQFNQLHVLLTTSNSSSTDESLQMNIDNQRILMNNKFILSKCWLLIGCLYLRCIRPESHLDPYLVMQIEEEDIEYEMKRINSELEFREHLQQHSIGAYNDNRLMPLKDIHPDSVTDHVNSGLLHPWLGVLINRRRCLSSKAEDLKHQLGASCKEILVCRQNSNFEYVEIRRRLTTFLTDFTEDFLLPYCPQDNNNNYTEMIEKNFKLQTIHRWIEATANLGNWLTEPKRYHMFADIITPFLYGLFYVYRGLRIVFHEIISPSNALNVSVSSMIKSLVTNLLPNAYTDDNKNNAIGVLSSSSSSPANQRSSRPMLLAMELASPESRRIIQQLVNSVNNSMLLGNLKNNDDTLRKTQEIQFRISSFILNLLWLHNAEKNTSTLPFENMHKLIGRILNSMLRPLAQHWRHIEAERKRLSELRAALFLEADRRKQLIRNELQGIKTDAKGGQQRRQHHQQQSDRCTSPELIDQSLNEELDWRLRFSESACLKAFSELSIGANKLSASGLAKEDQIQQTVNKLEAVDNWLKKSLNTSDKYWIPDENELVYFINRLVYLLLLCCSNSETPSSTSINNPMIHSKSEMPIHQLDVTNAFSWHWHTVLFGYNLASWLSIQSKMSLDPAVDKLYTLPFIGITAYMGQYDIRAHPILPIIGSSPSSSSSSNSTSPSNYHFNSKWLIMKSHCYNVYLDPIPLEEAEKLNSILKHLESQVKHILNQWPGQPSLLRLLTIIRRIESFTVSDPLMKFVTGIEMLWQEMQEWERDAARHVSLTESSKEVCNLLVCWRKMELSYWLATLDSAEIQIGNRCMTLWFHLYDLFLRPGSYREQQQQQQMNAKRKQPSKNNNDNADVGDDNGDVQQLEIDRLDALIELFEKGPIGEFISRWRLVASIYSALNIWPGLSDKERSSSKRIVGNAVWFYAQFLPYISEELKNLRKPIEKEMKGIVNITKWGHYSRFWSVKTSVDRCKKSIHKHVKNWESILQRPVRPIFESIMKIPDFIKSPNGMDDITSGSGGGDDQICCSSGWLKLEMSDISKVLHHSSIRRSFDYLQQVYCKSNEGGDNLPLHIKRLPSLIKRLHKHVYTVAHNSPILQWIKQLRSGVQLWMALVQDLSQQTERLNSSCPSGNQLAKFNKQKANRRSKLGRKHDGDEDGGDDDGDDDEELKKTCQWYQEFTALQQRKRLALSDWLKIATRKSQQSHDISDHESSSTIPSDSDELTNDNNNADSNEYSPDDTINNNNATSSDDDLFEALQLPSLGLSYRRGQRETQTGHMSRFLVQLHGDPWSYVNQEIGHSHPDSNSDSDEVYIRGVCSRLSRLIALRASLPRVPGPQDGDVDTSAAILNEIGGPNNLFRLIGIMDDLLNQCSTGFKVCSQFTNLCKRINYLVQQYAVSLNVFMSEDKVVKDEKQTDLFTGYISDPERLKRIQVSTHNLDQIIREHIYQWSVFWTAFQKQTGNKPFELNQLSSLFGSEAWSWLTTASGQLLASLSNENPAQLTNLTESHLTPLKLAMHQVLKCTTQLLNLNTFLWNPVIRAYCEELYLSVEYLQSTLTNLVDSYKQANCTQLFAPVFQCLQEQITVEWGKIHCELQVLSPVMTSDDYCDIDMLDTHASTTTIEINDMSSVRKPDERFEQLVNHCIHSILKAVQIIHKSDQIVNELDQIALMNHFSKVLTELMTSVLPQVIEYLSRTRSILQNTQTSMSSDRDLQSIRLVLIHCVYPLMDGLSKALSTRCIQFWSLLDAWFKLGECAMRITGRLITEGFCRPANLPRDQNSQAADGNGATSNTSDGGQMDTEGASSGGTSLTSTAGGDTSGAKDVSNELECQEQIEGLMNDKQSENNDPKGKNRDGDNDTNGIEMPDDDFQGQYDDPDMENCSAEDDNSSDQVDQENFDEKMGETDGPGDDLANEMWASDDDDDEEKEENEAKDGDGADNNEQDNKSSSGVQDDKMKSKQEGERNADGVQEQNKQSSKSDEQEEQEGDSAEPSDNKTDNRSDSSSPKRKKPKHPQNASGKRTTVANEDCMEHPETDGGEPTSPKKPNVDDDDDNNNNDQGLPEDTEFADNADQSPGRDVEDLPGDLFDNQMDIDAEDDNGEEEPCGHPEHENNQSTLDEKDLEQKEGETMDIDEYPSGEDPAKVEVFPYHGSGSGDLNTQSNVLGGPDENVEDVDKTETNDDEKDGSNMDSSAVPPQQLTDSGNQSSQGDASGEKYTPSTRSGDQSETSRTEPLSGQQQQQQQRQTNRNQSRSGPKPTSENRSLANKQKSLLSGVETLEVDSEQQSGEQDSSSNENDKNSQLFQHLPNPEDPNSNNANANAPCVRDSATLDQAEKQLTNGDDDESMNQCDDTGLEKDDNIDNKDDDNERLPTSELEPTDAKTNILPQQLNPFVKGKQYPGGDEAVESDPTAEFVPTLGAQRPPQSIICTRTAALILPPSTMDNSLAEMSTDLQILDNNKFAQTSLEGALEWATCCQRSSGLARQLCEALRLVLEPTKASRLRGDYRTGKRINIRKIIPYLASQFRKDKIWLRRSQPSQREYRILIAVDDSSSMSENLCKQMTFESLTTVVTALNLLEVGRIGVCSFGESVRVLHDPKDPWATDVGPRVLSQFTFEQPKTSLVQLLHCTIHLMNSIGYTNSSSTIPSQLLLILSDGVFSEDPQSQSLQAAVRLARDSHIFPVCLILDDVRKKHSIFDLRRYCGPGKLQPYMDVFPLPYYLVLRDLACLPNLLADALRQWFELESSFGR